MSHYYVRGYRHVDYNTAKEVVRTIHYMGGKSTWVRANKNKNGPNQYTIINDRHSPEPNVAYFSSAEELVKWANDRLPRSTKSLHDHPDFKPQRKAG